jgi:hypothetical protein
MSLYEDLQNQNKQIEALKAQLQQLEYDKKQTQELIESYEKQDGSDKINKLTIINLIEDLQVKIDNYHFKNNLAIQVNFDINKLSLIYKHGDEHLIISESDSTTLTQLEKWINFQSNIIKLYKILEETKGNLQWVNSKYNEQGQSSNITFNVISNDAHRNNIEYKLIFNYPNHTEFNIEAKQLISYEHSEIYLGVNDKKLKAKIISSEVDSVNFNPKYDDTTDTFNVYLKIDEYAVKSSTLKDVIEKTSNEIFNYKDFNIIYHIDW